MEAWLTAQDRAVARRLLAGRSRPAEIRPSDWQWLAVTERDSIGLPLVDAAGLAALLRLEPRLLEAMAAAEVRPEQKPRSRPSVERVRARLAELVRNAGGRPLTRRDLERMCGGTAASTLTAAITCLASTPGIVVTMGRGSRHRKTYRADGRG